MNIDLLKRMSSLAGGPHSTMDSVLASHPAALGSILGIPEDLFLTEIYFSRKFNLSMLPRLIDSSTA